jgi:hypothetical protein
VLGRIGQSLGDDVIRADLDPRGDRSFIIQLEIDGDGGTSCERLSEQGQTTFGQDSRVDAARQLA